MKHVSLLTSQFCKQLTSLLGATLVAEGNRRHLDCHLGSRADVAQQLLLVLFSVILGRSLRLQPL